MFEEITENEKAKMPKLVVFEWISVKVKRPEDGQIVAALNGDSVIAAKYHKACGGVFISTEAVYLTEWFVNKHPNLKWFPLPERKRQ